MFEALRLTITSEPFLEVDGVIQFRHRTLHILARAIRRLAQEGLETPGSHDFG